MKKTILVGALAASALVSLAAHGKVVASGPNPDGGGKLLLTNESCASHGLPFNTVSGVYMTMTDANGAEVARGCYVNVPGSLVVKWFAGDGHISERRYHAADYRDIGAPQAAVATQVTHGDSPVCDHLQNAIPSITRAAQSGLPMGLAFQPYRNDPQGMDVVEVVYRVATAGMDPDDGRREIRRICTR